MPPEEILRPRDCVFLWNVGRRLHSVGNWFYDVNKHELDLSGFYWEFEHHRGVRWWIRERLTGAGAWLHRKGTEIQGQSLWGWSQRDV